MLQIKGLGKSFRGEWLFRSLDLQINEQKAFQVEIIKYQVNVKILIIEPHPFLTGHKGKPPAEFQEKMLQIADDGRLQGGFMNSVCIGKVQKLQDIGIF